MPWDAKIGQVWVKFDFPPATGSGGTSASGLWTFQNSTPTDLRFQNSEPGFGDTAPYSARTYANQAGAIGKQSEVQAPADLARPYLCDLDNSHPGFLAPRLTWDKATTVNFTSPGSGPNNLYPYCVVDSAVLGMGIISANSAGELWWWYYNQTTREFTALKRVELPSGAPECHLPFPTWAPFVRGPVGKPVIHQSNATIWCPRYAAAGGGGAINLLANYPQGAFPTVSPPSFWHIIPFGQYVITFEQTYTDGSQAGMTISLRSPTDLTIYKPTTLSGQDAAPELGNADIRVQVPNVVACHPPVVYSGAVYFATDRSVMKVVFDDQNARLLVVPISTSFSRITGNPEFFQGSMFIPAANTLWKWTPGQLEFTPIPLDSFGDMPPDRGGGMITALRATANNLLIATQSGPASAADSSLFRMDANNVIGMLDYMPAFGVAGGQAGVLKAGVSDSGNANRQVQQINHFIDTSDLNAVVGVVCTDSTPAKRVVAIREGNRDPVFLPAANRKQVGGYHYWISPVDPGIGYGDFKQGLKIAAACADVTAAYQIRILYQTDTEINWAGTTIPGLTGAQLTNTIMAATGTWHVGMTLNNTTGGFSLGANGGYSGYAEVDLTTLSPPLNYRQIRWAVEIVGDPTGTVYPRLLGFKFYYSETPAMYIVHSVRIRMMVNDPDLALAPGDAYSVPPTTTDHVYDQFDELYTYAKNGTFVPFLDPNGDSRLVKITKLIFNGIDLIDSPTHQPVAGLHRYDKIVLQLALQEAASAA